MSFQNPFFHRGPIRDPTYFFGRESETGQMLSLLGNGQSLSVVGQRRIGKSSLLFHLADPTVFSQYGLKSHEHLFVYLDCSGLSQLDQPALYRLLLEEIAEALVETASPASELNILADPGPLTYRAFERAIRELTRQGWRPILLLDEFERLSRNIHLDPDFFSGLRALTAKYPLAYVTASKQPLLALTYADASALSSPFFNIFANIRLGLLAEAEARALLTHLAAKSAQPLAPTTLDFILALAGPHPLLLQIAGFHAFELQQAKGAALTDADYADLRRAFDASTEEHFSYYWRNLTPAEQRVLATLPAAQKSQPELVRQLERACLIRRGHNGYDYLSSAFRDFVQTQPAAGLLQAGPVAIDPERRQALLYGQPVSLTTTQYALLLHLVERAGQVVTPDTLEAVIWDDEYIEDPERLKAVIKGLRRVLGEAAVRLENVRGVGYRWRG